MKEVTITLKVTDKAPDEEEITAAVVNAVSFAENDGVWYYNWHVLDL